MTIPETLVGAGFALILGYVYRQWRITHFIKNSDIYTDNRDEADYGKGFGPIDVGLDDTIRKRIFKRDHNTCRFTKRAGIRGQPDNGFEYLKVGIGELTNGFVGEAELEVGHYPRPHALGGPTTDDNLVLMIKGLNRKLSDAVTPEMERWCRENGKKIWRKGIRKMSITQALKKLRKK